MRMDHKSHSSDSGHARGMVGKYQKSDLADFVTQLSPGDYEIVVFKDGSASVKARMVMKHDELSTVQRLLCPEVKKAFCNAAFSKVLFIFKNGVLERVEVEELV